MSDAVLELTPQDIFHDYDAVLAQASHSKIIFKLTLTLDGYVCGETSPTSSEEALRAELTAIMSTWAEGDGAKMSEVQIVKLRTSTSWLT